MRLSPCRRGAIASFPGSPVLEREYDNHESGESSEIRKAPLLLEQKRFQATIRLTPSV